MYKTLAEQATDTRAKQNGAIGLSARRERGYYAACREAQQAGRGPHPICNICDMAIEPGHAWDWSHSPVPKALGGKKIGLAHRLCNRRHGSQVVTPMVAKGKRVRRRHLGIVRPGLSRSRLPCGKSSRLTKKVDGTVERRETQLDKLRRTLANRRIGYSRV